MRLISSTLLLYLGLQQIYSQIRPDIRWILWIRSGYGQIPSLWIQSGSKVSGSGIKSHVKLLMGNPMTELRSVRGVHRGGGGEEFPDIWVIL